MFLAAVVQMTSTSDPETNWAQARGLVERAAGYGARLVATPENTNYLGPPADGPMLAGTRRCRVEGARASRVAAPGAARCSISDAVAGALRREDPCSSPRSCR